MSDCGEGSEPAGLIPRASMRPTGDDLVLDRYLDRIMGSVVLGNGKRFQKAARDGIFDFLVPSLSVIGDCTITTDGTGNECTYEVATDEATIELRISTMLPVASVFVMSGDEGFLSDLCGGSAADRALKMLLEEQGIVVLPEATLRARSRFVGYDIDGSRYGETYFEVLFTDEYVPWEWPGFVSSMRTDEGNSSASVPEAQAGPGLPFDEDDQQRLLEESLRHLPPRVQGAPPAMPMRAAGEDLVLDHFLYLALGPARPGSAATFQRAAARGEFDFLIPRFEELGDCVAQKRAHAEQVACVYEIVMPEKTLHIAISAVLPFCSVLIESPEALTFTALRDGVKEHDALRELLKEIHVTLLSERTLRSGSRYYADGGQRFKSYYELLVGTESLPWNCLHYVADQVE